MVMKRREVDGSSRINRRKAAATTTMAAMVRACSSGSERWLEGGRNATFRRWAETWLNMNPSRARPSPKPHSSSLSRGSDRWRWRDHATIKSNSQRIAASPKRTRLFSLGPGPPVNWPNRRST